MSYNQMDNRDCATLQQINTPKFHITPFYYELQGRFSPFISPMHNHQQIFEQIQSKQFHGFKLETIDEKVDIQQRQCSSHLVKQQIDDKKREQQKQKYISDKPKQLLFTRLLVDILVKEINDEKRLVAQLNKIISQDEKVLNQAYKILFKKFKKLKKTKQEMTKYCMRKAFKFLNDKLKSEGIIPKNENEINLRYFFQNDYEQELELNIPFRLIIIIRKNSTQKTMNSNFLKKVFSSEKFVYQYIFFLGFFKKLSLEDNQKKINYLASYLQDCININSISKLQNIKRLPWTDPMLKKTQELAHNLLQYAPPTIQKQIINKNRQHYNYFHQKEQQQKLRKSYQQEQQYELKRKIVLVSPPLNGMEIRKKVKSQF